LEADERANIRRIKGILRGWGVQIADEPQTPSNVPQLSGNSCSPRWMCRYTKSLSVN